jgi:two-component system chemotaxis response regulator CheB/chemosensory pili system protein ChpB (putative protein-glutamate methylesterase)
MGEATTAVALLFDDAGLGEQLRSALQERGARIVHEGPLTGLNRELLSSADADVLVVNLEDDDDEALDRLEQLLYGDRPRVVFNEGQASRRLEGWDRARWARHLAMKVLAMGDADPPRPPAPAEAAVAAPAVVSGAPQLEQTLVTKGGFLPEVDEEARQAAVSETLAAELEALLASDAPLEDASDFGTGLNYAAGEGVQLHDGVFGGDPATVSDDTPAQAAAPPEQEATEATATTVVAGENAAPLDPVPTASTPAPATEPSVPAGLQLDDLQLAPIDEAIPAVAVAAAPAFAQPGPGSRMSDAWTLLDQDAPPATTFERADPADFGIQKVSAADYLAPDAGDESASPILPGLSLELVSIEEAIAPQQHFEPSSPVMMLDVPASALPRLVVLGATTESTASVGKFLAALPETLRATVLHTQHLAGRPAGGLVDYFASQCALPVRLAEPGLRARVGEVIVVPSDRQVAVHRDGTLDLQQIEAGAAHVPSIDVSFTQAASAFGRDVVAIVFAGRSTDAVAGCQAVFDRGGQVWVEAGAGAQSADMVSGVLAEHLSHFAGMPHELAARLVEQIPEGQP